tara:strand:+ start:10435 stop:11139 length:705 start_codon:yes stop_codon:yes gene_type:complete
MDPISTRILLGTAGAGGLPEIGEFYEGGYFAGYISHTANGVATHGLIVAPKSAEVTRQFNPSGTGQSYTHSAYDGAANTADLADGGHPAHDYCAGLTIGGYSDWYLPAYAELEVAYGNLKPSSTANTTATFGTEAPNGHGPIAFNGSNYTSPLRPNNNTSSNPPQTSVSIFQSGGAQCFESNESNFGAIYLTSNQRFATYGGDIIALRFSDGRYRDQAGSTSYHYVRAFRRFAV